MSFDHWDRRIGQAARDRLASIRAEATALTQALQRDLAAAGAHTDPNFSSEGIRGKREELRAAAQAKHAPTLAKLRAAVSANTATLATMAGKVRPSLGTDVAGMTRAQIKWSQVQARLEAGAPIERIIADADLDTLVAVAEWAPSWLQAKMDASQPSGLDGAGARTRGGLGLGNLIDTRLMAIGDADTQWAIESDREARKVAAWFAPTADHAENLLAGRASDGLGAALSARMAEAAALAGT